MTSKSEMKRLACQLGSYRQLGDTVIVHPLSDEERAEWQLEQDLCPHCHSDNISYLTSGYGTKVNYCNDCTGGTW